MNLFRHLHGAHSLILVAAVAVLLPVRSRAQGTGDITATWSLVGSNVVITYQLNAARGKTYDISIVLRRESDRNFAVIPKAVSGDVGTGKFAAGVRQIRWDYRSDVPEGLTGDDYWFQVTAREVVEEGGSNWWIYAAGGAAAVTGAIILLGGGGSPSGSDQGPPQSTTLPGPPTVRPTP